jgi:hypothetical protein
MTSTQNRIKPLFLTATVMTEDGLAGPAQHLKDGYQAANRINMQLLGVLRVVFVNSNLVFDKDMYQTRDERTNRRSWYHQIIVITQTCYILLIEDSKSSIATAVSLFPDGIDSGEHVIDIVPNENMKSEAFIKSLSEYELRELMTAALPFAQNMRDAVLSTIKANQTHKLN